MVRRVIGIKGVRIKRQAKRVTPSFLSRNLLFWDLWQSVSSRREVVCDGDFAGFHGVIEGTLSLVGALQLLDLVIRTTP